jgi:hypothetical protein
MGALQNANFLAINVIPQADCTFLIWLVIASYSFGGDGRDLLLGRTARNEQPHDQIEKLLA